jgi:hypothetical protein
LFLEDFMTARRTPSSPLARFARSTGAWVALAAAAAGLASTAGCATNVQSLYVRGIAFGQSQEGGCTFDASATTFRSRGQIELAFAKTYEARVIVATELSRRGSLSEGRAEPNRVLVKSAEVTLADASGKEVLAYSVLTGDASIEPGGDSRAIVSTQLIPESAAEALRGIVPAFTEVQYFVNVRYFGRTLGGNDVQSEYFQYPLVVSNGLQLTGVAGPDGKPATAATLAKDRVCSGPPLLVATKSCFLAQDDFSFPNSFLGSCSSCLDTQRNRELCGVK